MEIVSIDVVFIVRSEGGRASMQGQEYFPVRLLGIPDGSRQGETIRATMELMYPDRLEYGPILTGEEFRLLEGNRVVATARALR